MEHQEYNPPNVEPSAPAPLPEQTSTSTSKFRQYVDTYKRHVAFGIAGSVVAYGGYKLYKKFYHN